MLATKLKEKKPAIRCSSLGALNKFPAKNTGIKSNVFVVSIPDYGYTPFGKPKQSEVSKALDHFNQINKTITEKFGVKYFNITDISRNGLEQPDLIAGDGLHPSGKMYGLWVQRIAKGLIGK